jgi:hypothetical protein
MSFVTGVTAQIADLGAFVAGVVGRPKEVAMNAGATDFRVNQVVMGGDRAGLCAAIFEVPSINAAMAVSGAINADADILAFMKDSGVQVVSRSLMRIVAERGTTDGQYGSMLMMSGGQISDEVADSQMGDGWEHISSAANGMRLMQAWAAGASPSPWSLLGWTDDLDAYATASAQSFADPKVQQNFADNNVVVHGRLVTKRLV